MPAGGVTEAALTMVSAGVSETVADTVTVAVPPTRRSTVVAMLPVPLAALHVEPALAVHVHVAFVRSAGSVSVTVAPTAASGPAFDTSMV